RDVRLWIENDELQDRQIVTQQAPDRLRLKQLRTVLNTGDTAEIRIHDEQTQVELRRMPGYVHRSHLQRPQSGARHGCVLEIEHHPDERGLTWTALDVQSIYEPLKRQVLMRIRIERHFPHVLQKVAEAAPRIE